MEKEYDVYLCGPLFTEEELRVCEAIETMCKDLDLKFFAPRLECKEEGKELGELNRKIRDILKNRDSYSHEDIKATLKDKDTVATKIFEKDLFGINKCKFLLACLDSVAPGTADLGSAVEVGYAFANNIPVITYSMKNYGSNIMVSQKIAYHADEIDLEQQAELKEVITKLLKLYNSGKSDSEIRNELYVNKLIETI